MIYAEKKERARQLAINWQLGLVNYGPLNRSWGYFIKWSNIFEKIGRKYGLLKEFKENGIL